MKRRGFTLIELLVVIAIISLLVSIGLVNIRGAEKKARDAAIKEAFHQLRTAAEVSFSNVNHYDFVCNDADRTLSDAGDFGKIEINIKRNNGNKEISCYESEDKQNYAASSPLVGRPGKHWCVDSRGGVPREVDTAVATSSCP